MTIEKKSFKPLLYDNVPRSQYLSNYKDADYENRPNLDIAEKSFYFSTCISYIADCVAQVPLIVEKINKNKKWEIEKKSPLNAIIDNPNPSISMFNLKSIIATGLIVDGTTLLGKERKEGVPVALWPVNPNKIYAEKGTTDLIKRYKYYGDNTERQYIQTKDMIHISRVSLQNLIWGKSEIKVGRKLFEFEQASVNWNLDILSNHGLVPAVYSIKDSLTKDQLEFLQKQIRQRKAGGPYAGEDLIIGADMNYHKLALTNEDIAWVEGKRLTRDDIFMMMRVPLVLLSPHEGNASDIEIVRMAFWQDRIYPLLTLIENSLRMQLTPEFEDPEKYRVVFDKTKIRAFKDQLFQDARSFNVYVGKGIAPRAAAKLIDLPVDEEDIIEGWFDASKYGDPNDEPEEPQMPSIQQIGIEPIAELENPMNSDRQGEELGARRERPNELAQEPRVGTEEGLNRSLEKIIAIQYKLLSEIKDEDLDVAIEFLDKTFAASEPNLYKQVGKTNIKLIELYYIRGGNKKQLKDFMQKMKEILYKEL